MPHLRVVLPCSHVHLQIVVLVFRVCEFVAVRTLHTGTKAPDTFTLNQKETKSEREGITK